MKIDAHSHMTDNGMPLPEMMRDMKAGFDTSGFDAVCFASDTSASFDAIHKNLLCFLYKLMFPQSCYIFVSLDYHIPGTRYDTYGFGAQAEMFAEIGVDGFHMYEGKPNARNACGNIPLTGEKYKSFFSFLERNNMPVSLHPADPPEFWDINYLEAYPFEKGWFFDDLVHSSYQEIWDEVLAVAKTYPKLKIILPQFGFLLPDLPKMAGILEKHKNLMFDAGPMPVFYELCTNNKDELRAFFEKYSNRIIFACTGVCNDFTRAHEKAEKAYAAIDSLGLQASTAKALYTDNFTAICPYKPLNTNALVDYCNFIAQRLDKCPPAPPRNATIHRTREAIDAIRDLLH